MLSSQAGVWFVHIKATISSFQHQHINIIKALLKSVEIRLGNMDKMSNYIFKYIGFRILKLDCKLLTRKENQKKDKIVCKIFISMIL